ncbi:MAG: replication-relaxation family protein, partial [Planctomycetes bacterium]|nr:replication-relaxation family protein [Planctomycetota bacterium]
RYMRSERTCQYQLAALVQLGYIGVMPVRSTSPNFPNVYFATGKGVRLVREDYERLDSAWRAQATESARAKGTSLDSILHELCLTQFGIDVGKTINAREDLELLFTERRYFRADRQLRYTHQRRRRAIMPDLGFMLRVSESTASGGTASSVSPTHLLHLVELDHGTRSLSSVRRQLRQYDIWARSEDARKYLTHLYTQWGESIERPRFRLLLIAQAKDDCDSDQRRLADLFLQALELPSVMRDRIWLTSAESLRPETSSSRPLAEAVWLRVRDARPWLAEFRSKAAQLRPRQNSVRAQRKCVAEVISRLPCHPLFPHPHETIVRRPSDSLQSHGRLAGRLGTF